MACFQKNHMFPKHSRIEITPGADISEKDNQRMDRVLSTGQIDVDFFYNSEFVKSGSGAKEKKYFNFRDGLTMHARKTYIGPNETPEQKAEAREGYSVACGWCSECKVENAKQMAHRAGFEVQTQRAKGFESCMVNLTYSEEALAERQQGRNLSLKEIQDFIMRLRTYIERDPDTVPRKIKYLAAGEYGPVGGRPHYHMIIFGWAPPDQYRIEMSRTGRPQFGSEIVDRLWQNKGRATIGTATVQSAGYIARYCQKKTVNSLPKYDAKAERLIVPEKWHFKDFEAWDAKTQREVAQNLAPVIHQLKADGVDRQTIDQIIANELETMFKDQGIGTDECRVKDGPNSPPEALNYRLQLQDRLIGSPYGETDLWQREFLVASQGIALDWYREHGDQIWRDGYIIPLGSERKLGRIPTASTNNDLTTSLRSPGQRGIVRDIRNGNMKQPIPRYFLYRLQKENPELYAKVKAERKALAKDQPELTEYEKYTRQYIRRQKTNSANVSRSQPDLRNKSE